MKTASWNEVSIFFFLLINMEFNKPDIFYIYKKKKSVDMLICIVYIRLMSGASINVCHLVN